MDRYDRSHFEKLVQQLVSWESSGLGLSSLLATAASSPGNLATSLGPPGLGETEGGQLPLGWSGDSFIKNNNKTIIIFIFSCPAEFSASRDGMLKL